MSTRLTALARKSKTDRLQPPLQPQRERGLWSFLTWSFFISQVLAAEGFLGSSAHAAGDGDASANGSDHAAAEASLLPAQPLDGVQASEEAGPSLQGGSAAETAPQQQALAEPPAATESADDQHAGAGAASSQHGQGSVGGFGATRDPLQTATGPELPQAPLPDLPGGDPTGPLGPIIGGLGPIVGGLLEPVLDTVTNLVGSLGAVLGQVVAPVVELVGSITQILGDVVGEVVAPLLSTVGELLSDVGDLLAPVLQSVVAPVGDLLGSLLQPVGSLLGDTIAPVTESLEPVLAPVAHAVEPVLQPLDAIVDEVAAPLGDALGLQGLVASTGSIVLAELPVVNSLHLDDLFHADGQYTDYHLALGTGASGPTPILPVADSVITLVGDTLSDALGPDGADGHSGHPVGLLGPLTGTLDDLHSRSLGEVLGL